MQNTEYRINKGGQVTNAQYYLNIFWLNERFGCII